jgi:hypothetical protein
MHDAGDNTLLARLPASLPKAMVSIVLGGCSYLSRRRTARKVLPSDGFFRSVPPVSVTRINVRALGRFSPCSTNNILAVGGVDHLREVEARRRRCLSVKWLFFAPLDPGLRSRYLLLSPVRIEPNAPPPNSDFNKHALCLC